MIKSIYFIQNGLAITNKLNNKFPCTKRRRHTGLNHPKNKLNCEFYHV